MGGRAGGGASGGMGKGSRSSAKVVSFSGGGQSVQALNKQLTVKRFETTTQFPTGNPKVTFSVGGGSYKPNYGVYIEGKGFLKWKNSAGGEIISYKKKSTAQMLAKGGFTSYKDIEFINPVSRK